MTQRLSKIQKAIYEAHKAAYISGVWTLVDVRTKEDIVEGVRAGGTCQALWDQAELKSDLSITSLLIANQFKHVSVAMDRAMKATFQKWLTSVGIS